MATVIGDTAAALAPGVRGPIRTARPSSNQQSTTLAREALRHEQFHTADPDAAQRFFAAAYRPGWRTGRLMKGSAVTHRRCAADVITIDEVVIQGRFDCDIRAADSVLVIQPRVGSLTITGDRVVAADAPVLAADGIERLLQVNSASFHVVCIEPGLLRKVAAAGQTPLPQQIQFLSSRPRSDAAVRAWRAALDYVTDSFASAETAKHPRIVAAAGQLLAAAVLECFPSNATAGQDRLSDPLVPKAVRTALSFIHRHAGSDIGVKDVAAEVHLTPRAVQYLFRQQLDTTPTEYLRRVRLHRAHQDLLSGHRTNTSVGEIAQRWGFAHTGRFAVLYRQTYGESPHTTLKHHELTAGLHTDTLRSV